MKEAWISKIDSLIEEYTDQLAADTVRLVNIKSVESKPFPDAPFGEGAKKLLDTFWTMAEDSGLFCTDFKCGVIRAAIKQSDADLGIWLHGDVVPEGNGWRYPPYDATQHEGCIIGRGAADNKGQLAAMLTLLRILKELDFPLRYNPAIYLGSNEESGMRDLIGDDSLPDAPGFLNTCQPPRLSLVPDGGFPLGYGGKGALTLKLRSDTPLHGFFMTAGQDDAPGCATAVLDGIKAPEALPECTVKQGTPTVISAFSPPRHGSNPDPAGNMITKLCSALLDARLVAEEDRRILQFLKEISLDVYGELLGIASRHKILGRLTVFSKKIDCAEGYPELTVNIRYPLGITHDEIVKRVQAYAKTVGFSVTRVDGTVSPYLADPNTPVARALCSAAQEIVGKEKAPYTISGATYAHHLPNAYVFGTDANLPPDSFPVGRGGAHGIDEAVSIDRLKRAIRIYARALLALNEMEW